MGFFHQLPVLGVQICNLNSRSAFFIQTFPYGHQVFFLGVQAIDYILLGFELHGNQHTEKGIKTRARKPANFWRKSLLTISFLLYRLGVDEGITPFVRR